MTEMTCAECQGEIIRYLEGDLPGSLRRQVRDHLRLCSWCAQCEEEERVLQRRCRAALNQAGFRPRPMVRLRRVLRWLFAPVEGRRRCVVITCGAVAVLLAMALGLYCIAQHCGRAHGGPCGCPPACPCAPHPHGRSTLF